MGQPDRGNPALLADELRKVVLAGPASDCGDEWLFPILFPHFDRDGSIWEETTGDAMSQKPPMFEGLPRHIATFQNRVMAEREGFEPSVPRKRDNGFRVLLSSRLDTSERRVLRRHPSKVVKFRFPSFSVTDRPRY